MAGLATFRFEELDLEALSLVQGRVAVVAGFDGALDKAGRRVARLTKGALKRLVESPRFEKAKEGEVISLGYPSGMAAEAVGKSSRERTAVLESFMREVWEETAARVDALVTEVES